MIEAGTNGSSGVVIAVIRGVSHLRKQNVGPTRSGWYEALVDRRDWDADSATWRVGERHSLVSEEWPTSLDRPPHLTFVGRIAGVLFFTKGS